jgi:dienelactone hydrolase
VFHGGAGLGAHERERSRMLADLGFVAFAPDLFGEIFENRARGIEVVTRLVEQPETLRARLADALACLRAQPGVDASRIGAIGFCFGGHAAIELARSARGVRGVVSFHGGLKARAPAKAGEVSAAVLACTGAADPFVTRDDRAAFEDEMTKAKVAWQMHLYGGAMHGFTHRDTQQPGCAYDDVADRRSWSAMRSLFADTLSP